MSLYLGNTLVAGRASRMIFCTSQTDYRRQLLYRGASGQDDFYYVPSVSQSSELDNDGLAIQLVERPVDSSEGAQNPQLTAVVKYYGQGDDLNLWNGLEWTKDGKRWTKFSEFDAKNGGATVTLSMDRGAEVATSPDAVVYIRAVVAGNKSMCAPDRGFWRRIGVSGDDVEIVDGDFRYLLDSIYREKLDFSYQGVSCVFASAFAECEALVNVGVQLPQPEVNRFQRLSATPSCYMGMFQGCGRLSSVATVEDIVANAENPGVNSFAALYSDCAGLRNVFFNVESAWLSSAFKGWLNGILPATGGDGPSGVISVDSHLSDLTALNDVYTSDALAFKPPYWEIRVIEDDELNGNQGS